MSKLFPSLRRSNQDDNQNGNGGGNGNDNQKLPANGMNWIWVFILVFLVGQVIFNVMRVKPQEIGWSKFKNDMLAQNEVERIDVVNKEKAEVYIKESFLGKGKHTEIDPNNSGPHYVFNIGSVETFDQALREAQSDKAPEDRIPYNFIKRTDWMGNILSWVLPFLIIIAIWLFILNRMRPPGMGGGRGGVFDFGKANTALKKEKTNVTFEDVAGLDEVKVEVREIVDFLKNSEKYTKLGAKIPKGIILIGPPGTGKTLLAKAVAGEASVPFFSMSGSEFVEMFVGVGASRVRDLFKKAKQSAPSIVFIDEIDAIGRSRGKAMSFQSNDERENTLNQLLTEMDGFGANAGVIVLAATNRGEILDRALLRPGRFDRQIYIELPTKLERRAIFDVHAAPLKMDEDIDLDLMATQTPGFSGADIANICNEAALIAARKGKEAVQMKDFFDAVDRVVAGLERKSKIISEKEKRTIAYHEAGHATASWYLPHADSLLKVSIVPRGRSLGAAWYLPQENQIYTKAQLVDRICSTLGGRAAEEIVFGEISSGALDDLEKVTKQAYNMVSFYGLDEEIGNRSFYDSTGRYEQSFQKPYSDYTAELIDKRVKVLIDEAYEKTKKILIEHREEMDALAEQLLVKETIFKNDLINIFKEDPKNLGNISD